MKKYPVLHIFGGENMTIKKGDLYYADLSLGIGSEQGGIRPVVILQNNKGNKYAPTVIVASLTSGRHRKRFLPTHFTLAGRKGLRSNSIILLEQIRTIDKSRLLNKIGSLSSREIRLIDQKIKISLGICNYRKEHRCLKWYL
mgnify:FL=1